VARTEGRLLGMHAIVR